MASLRPTLRIIYGLCLSLRRNLCTTRYLLAYYARYRLCCLDEGKDINLMSSRAEEASNARNQNRSSRLPNDCHDPLVYSLRTNFYFFHFLYLTFPCSLYSIYHSSNFTTRSSALVEKKDQVSSFVIPLN